MSHIYAENSLWPGKKMKVSIRGNAAKVTHSDLIFDLLTREDMQPTSLVLTFDDGRTVTYTLGE